MPVDLRTIRRALPEGRTLPEELWTRRHRGILVLLWAHAAFIPLFALGKGFSLMHTALEAAVVPALALIATSPSFNRRLRSGAASFGLLSASAVLVHLSGGVIEMHFHFFVIVAVVALYQDWICFLAAIAYVLVHHGVLGALDPDSVFNHYAALNHPWKWAAIHAFFIAGISVACLVTWREDENILDREREAEDRLREETRIVETLNDVGRTVAADLDLHTVVQRVTDAATDLTAAAFGAFLYNVVNAKGESYMLFALSGAPAEAFAGLPMPRNTPVFAPTFAGVGTVRLDDVTADPRFGQTPPHHGLPPGHPPVRSYLAVPVRSARGRCWAGCCSVTRSRPASPMSTSAWRRGSRPTPPSPSTTPACTTPSTSPGRWRSGPSGGWRCWPTPAGCWPRRSTSTRSSPNWPRSWCRAWPTPAWCSWPATTPPCTRWWPRPPIRPPRRDTRTGPVGTR